MVITMNKLKMVILYFFILIGLKSCVPAKEDINTKVFNRNIKSEKSVILSCYHCSCVTSFLDSIDFDLKKYKSISVYTDTNCTSNKYRFKHSHLDQKILDSIFEDNYNAILFYKRNSKIDMLLLKTEQSKNFKMIFDNFFK